MVEYIYLLFRWAFVRKTELKFERDYFGNDKFMLKDLSKPIHSDELDKVLNQLLKNIPPLKRFALTDKLPHGIYYPKVSIHF